MALRELVTVLRYELREGNLKKYVDGYRRAEKAVNTAAKAANDQLKRGVQVANRELASMNRTGNQLTRTMGRLTREAREFGIGLRQGARQGYGEVLRQMDRVEARQRRLRRTGGAGGAGMSTGLVAGAIQGAIATFSLRSLMDASDEWAGSKARIGLQTPDAATRNRSVDFLFRSAQQTGQEFSPLADTFVSMARGRQALGLSNDQTLMLSNTISKLMTIGGGSAASQAAALTQFGQAMNTGVLRGEELNSILEQAPRLAQAIADALGTTVGNLRTLGQDGKITAKQIADGLLRQTKQVDEEFKRLPMTFSRSMTQLRNQLIRNVGVWNENTRAAEAFNKAASWIIDHLPQIGAAIAGLAGGWAAVKAFNALRLVFTAIGTVGRPLLLFFARLSSGKVAQAFAKFGPMGLRFLSVLRWIGTALATIGSIGAGPLLAIAAVIAVAAAAVYKYWEPIKAFFGGVWEGVAAAGSEALQELTNALSPLMPAFETIGGWLQQIWDWFVQLIKPVQSTSQELENAANYGKLFGEALLFPLKINIKLLGMIIKLVVGLAEAIGTAIGWIVVTADSAWSSLKSGVEALWNWITAKFAAGWNFVSGLIPDWAKKGIGITANGTGSLGGVSAGSVVNAGRSAVNQTVTQTASVQVTAPPGGNPAAYGAAAQRGTSKAMTGFQYQLPTPVESF
ncbi:tape measure protein [Stenotrophomonas sp. GD03680]|uniref:tape measure protein n=1 Tax=Stenotrophomonas sp. GD03680 TaxID=2975365 RepID=UPI0024479068|nr:tape measure protein [Stenotrophomonas sp. GD03680]MDH2023572.1 tape measure protein [Stenotrophomonas sp. GD03680]